MTNYMSSVGRLPQSAARWIGASCLTLFVVLLSLMGVSVRLARPGPAIDHLLRRLCSPRYPFFLMVTSGNIELADVAQLLTVLLYVPYPGAGPAFYAEIFPTRVRYTALSNRVVDRLQYSCSAVRRVRAVYRYVPGAGDREQARAGRPFHHRRNHHSHDPIADSRNCVCAAAMIGWIVSRT
jgi:hypothetical protein